MKRCIIDTNIFIDHLRGKPEATYFLKGLRKQYEVCFSVITRIEIMTGARENEMEYIEELLNIYKEVGLGHDIAKLAGMYMNRYVRKNNISIGDAIIAATGKNLEADLFTLDTNHFPMDDINIIRPY